MALRLPALALAGAVSAAALSANPAAAAATSTIAAPTLPPPLVALGASRFDPAEMRADWGCRWGCGWGHRHYRHRHNRVDAGDVILGAVIIGGIAAIASSSNRRQRDRDVVIVERDVRDRDWRDDNRRYDDRRDDRRPAPRGSGAAGLDNAVNLCLDRIERDVRVDSVDNVERTGSGWLISGGLFNGEPFQCRIGNSGQIEGIDYGNAMPGGGFTGSGLGTDARSDGQWDDQRYTSARRAVGGLVRPDIAVQEAATTAPRGQSAQAERMPAYPGGPIPGEDIPETIDGDL
jgi:hypothetical protein